VSEAGPSPAAERSRPAAAQNDPGGRNAGLLDRLKNLFGRRSGESVREAIEELIEENHVAEEPIDPDERDLLRNILTLREITVADVMVPRGQILAVEESTSFHEVISIIAKSAHSRLPVYRDDLDQVIGMVHIKDVIAAIASGHAPTLKSLLRKVLFVPLSMGCLSLLAQMRQTRTHMALVVDEYGGIDGLVTIEDVVEQIVGDIEDEHEDQAAPAIDLRPDGVLLTRASVPISDLEKVIGPFLSEDEQDSIDTIGGLVYNLAGRVPEPGERVIHASGIEIEVLSGDRRRIDRLRLENLPRAAFGMSAPSS